MGRRDSCSPRRPKPMISTSSHHHQEEKEDDSIPLSLILTFVGNSENRPYTHRSSPVFTGTPSKQKSAKRGSVTPTSLRSLRQCRCIHQPEAKDQSSICEGKMKSVRCLGCDMLLPISEVRNTLGGMSDLVRVKNSNEKPKKKDGLLQSVQPVSTSEVNDNMASTPSSSLAYENDIFDVVSLKSEFDGFNENCRKNNCHLQSAQQSLICEGNDSILYTPSCKPSFQNEDIERLPDFVNTAGSNENLRVKYCHDMLLPIADLRKELECTANMVSMKNINEKPKKKDGLLQSVQSISISEVNDDMVSTPSSALAYENNITDVDGLKSESDGFNENFRKNDCHLRSAQQSFICERNDLIISTRSCKPSFQNEDIGRLPDLVNTERSNDNLRENYCYTQYVKQISGSEGDVLHFPSLTNPTFDSHLENNQSKADFASIDDLNQRLEVKVPLQCSQKVSANVIWDTEQCVKISLLQNNGQQSQKMLSNEDRDILSVQLKLEEKQVIPEASVKSQIDRYNENLSEEDFCLQSPKRTDISEGNDTVLLNVSCISPFENKGIERLPGSMTAERFKDNLGKKECHLPSAPHLCSCEADNEHLSSCSGIPAFENDLDPNFASVDKLNEKLKVRNFLQALQKTSDVTDQDRENFGETNRLQNKVEQSESFLLKEYHEGISACFHSEEENETANTVTPLETAEGSGLRADEDDRIYEQANDLKHQVVSSHWSADSKGYQKYVKVANFSKGSPLKDIHVIHEERMTSCDNDRECLTDKEQKLDQPSNEIEVMEMARKQYFAALIAAKEDPGEESLALAAGLRLELESFLSLPSFSSVVSSFFGMHRLET